MKTKPVDITMSLKIKEEKMEIVNTPATECLRPNTPLTCTLESTYALRILVLPFYNFLNENILFLTQVNYTFYLDKRKKYFDFLIGHI